VLRGLLLGVSWGGLVAATAVTTFSLVYSKANRSPMADAPQEVALLAKPDVDAEPIATASPAVGTVEAPAQGAAQQPSEADNTLPTTDTAQVPTGNPASPAMSPSDETPVGSDAVTAQAPDVMIPAEGIGETEMVVNDEGTQMMNADDAPILSGELSVLPDAPLPEAQPQSDTQTDAMSAPAMQDAPAEGDAAQAELPSQADAPDVQEAALPQITTPDQIQTPEQDATLAVPSPAVPPASQIPTDAAPEPAAPASEGQFDTARASVPKITNLAPNVKTNRLPTIGGTAEADAVEVGQEVTPEADKGALSTHAMAFENPDAKPMLSVVLIDDPQHPVSDDVLSHLPFALSFAVDAVRDDAHAVAGRYRAAGFEVLMLTNLPFGANATDVEVAFGAYTRAIPEAVGVLDLGANGFLRGPSTATQIAGIMSDKGYGLITPSKGLNSAQKAAMREGVPAALLYRELDEDGEKPSVIRRYMDRAAFRAAQEGSVIMLGHTRPDTIEALVTWALEDRAASVAIAPVSAVLLAQ